MVNCGAAMLELFPESALRKRGGPQLVREAPCPPGTNFRRQKFWTGRGREGWKGKLRERAHEDGLKEG